MPDLFILDTPTYAEWYQKEYRLPSEKIRLLPLGADDRVFHPLIPEGKPASSFVCLYYGTYIPNHGVPVIIEAARRLANHNQIYFEMVGGGPERRQAEQLAQDYGIKNLRFIDWLEKDELVRKIAAADVILGTFGNTPQALMTMQNKIHEGLAMAKPVLNGDSPAIQALLRHGEEIYLCERENPQALADAILTLYEQPDLRAKIASQVYAFYQEHLNFDLLCKKLCNIVMSITQTAR
jgi:glycosyltransferase involved in cell wall biosynthesis